MYINQRNPSSVDTIPPPKFCDYLNNWIQGNLLVTWLPNTDLVSAFDTIRPPPVHNLWVPPPNPPNPVNPPNNTNANPRSNVNNLNWDPRIVGDPPLAKKIRNCKFTGVIKAMDAKGHPVLKTTAGEPHCLSWHLQGKCKLDCHRKADHIHAPPSVINPLIE